jgi:CheY-like chemotaxis protein
VALILVVDDDLAVRRALERVFLNRGHQVLLAADGGQGLRVWRERGADLVLLDIHMPGTNGIEVLVQLRGLAPRLPVIVMSGGYQTQKLDLLGDAELLGASAVLRKPFTLEEIFSLVDRLCGDGIPSSPGEADRVGDFRGGPPASGSAGA